LAKNKHSLPLHLKNPGPQTLLAYSKLEKQYDDGSTHSILETKQKKLEVKR
jgi:hypothetical protein